MVLSYKNIVLLFFSGLAILVVFNIVREYKAVLIGKLKKIIYLNKKEKFYVECSTELELEMKHNEYLADTLNLAKEWEYDKGEKIQINDRVAFTCKEYGYIQGYFVGLRKADSKMFSYNFVLKITSSSGNHFEDSLLISAPIEFIDKNSIAVYKKHNL